MSEQKKRPVFVGNDKKPLNTRDPGLYSEFKGGFFGLSLLIPACLPVIHAIDQYFQRLIPVWNIQGPVAAQEITTGRKEIRDIGLYFALRFKLLFQAGNTCQ